MAIQAICNTAEIERIGQTAAEAFAARWGAAPNAEHYAPDPLFSRLVSLRSSSAARELSSRSVANRKTNR